MGGESAPQQRFQPHPNGRPFVVENTVINGIAVPSAPEENVLAQKPSSLAPRRLIAALDLSFSASVLNSTRTQPSSSKAWVIMSSFASVLMAVRLAVCASHVHPISTRLFARSKFAKRVLPTIAPDARSTVTNGIAVPSSRILIAA